MNRAVSRCLSTLTAFAATFALVAPGSFAQVPNAGTRPNGGGARQGVTFSCNVYGPDRTCGSPQGIVYQAQVFPPSGGLTYAWSLSTTTTGGCPGTGTTAPSFTGPTDQPTVNVAPGTSGGRFVLILTVSDGISSSTCCLSINVTPSTTTTALVSTYACANSPHTFCTTAGGTGPFTYSWTKNGTVIPGATNSCYTATSGAPTVSDTYCVTTTGSGACGVPVTSCATLTAIVPTTTTPLISASRCEGQSYTFCTSRNFPGPYTWTWTRNGSTIAGATSSCHTAIAGPPGTVDTYCVTVQGPCGPPVTACGTLTTNPPTTATALANASTCAGATHTFCTTAGGTGPFTYSWTRNGSTIAGATQSCFTATAPAQMMIDTYCATVTGTCGSVTVCGQLRALANTTATPLTPWAACEGDVHTFCTTVGGIGPFTYSWTRNGVTIAGASSNCYTANAPASGVTDTYCVTVTGTCGPPVVQCTTFFGNLNTTATPIGSFSECTGSTHTFCTTPGGTGPFVYAWKRNGIFIPGANLSCYTATAGPPGSTDLYCVLVTGACNTVTQCGTLGSISCAGSQSTLTQGTYGNPAGSYNGVGSPTLVEDLLQNDLVVGMLGANSLTLRAGGNDSHCINDHLPTDGMSEPLPGFGDETLEADCQTAPVPIPLINGKFENVLMGQVVTLALNVRLSDGMTSGTGCTTLPSGLADQGVCQTMVSRKLLPGPDGCIGTADDVPDLLGPDGDPVTPDNLMTITFPDAVIVSLNELGLTQTVGGVLQLGNLALADLPTWTATMLEISQAVDAANLIFEEGREVADCSHP